MELGNVGRRRSRSESAIGAKNHSSSSSASEGFFVHEGATKGRGQGDFETWPLEIGLRLQLGSLLDLLPKRGNQSPFLFPITRETRIPRHAPRRFGKRPASHESLVLDGSRLRSTRVPCLQNHIEVLPAPGPSRAWLDFLPRCDRVNLRGLAERRSWDILLFLPLWAMDPWNRDLMGKSTQRERTFNLHSVSGSGQSTIESVVWIAARHGNC